MPKFPVIEQQVAATSQGATGEDFGAAIGRGMEQLGNTITDIEVRRRSREDVIEGVRAKNQFEQKALEEFTRMQTEDDISSTKAPKTYSEFLKQSMTSVLDNYGGSSEGRARLAAELEGMMGNHSREMYRSSTAAQFKVLDNEIVTGIKTQADMAGDLPESIDDRLAAIDQMITEYAPALPPEAEKAYREQARSQVISSVMANYLNAGDYDAAAAVLGKKGVAETLSPDLHRQFKTQITVGQRQDEKESQRLDAEVKIAKLKAGIEIDTERMKLKIKNSGLKWSDMSPMQKIDTINADRVSRGQSVLNQEQQDKVLGVYIKQDGDESMFGASLRGRALGYVTENATAFAEGMMTPEQENQWQSSVTELTRPIVDRETGRVIQPSIPPFLQEAYNRRGAQIPGTEATQRPEMFGAEGLPDYGETSLWNMGSEVAGPDPKIRMFLGRMPIVGGPIGEAIGSGPAEQAHQQFQSATNLLVNFMRVNAKMIEGERAELKKEVFIDPGLWSNTAALHQRMIGIDKSLADRYKLNLAIVSDPNTPAEELRRATSIIQGISWFRRMLDAPVPVKSKAEMDKVMEKNPNAKVQLPSGRIMARKQAQ